MRSPTRDPRLPEQPGTRAFSLTELADILNVALAGVDADPGRQPDAPRRITGAVVDIARSALPESSSNRQRVTDRRTSAT